MAAGVLAVLLGLSPTAATAQSLTTTERTFLSNEDETGPRDRIVYNTRSQAQAFTTGDLGDPGVNVVPRTLTLWFGTGTAHNASSSDLSVEIWRNNDDGEPRNLYFTLINPSNVGSAGAKEFTYSGNAGLGSGATYHIVVKYSRGQGNQNPALRTTSVTSISESLTGWEIGPYVLGTTGGSWSNDRPNQRLRFKLEGVRHPVAATGAPTITPSGAPAVGTPLTAALGTVDDANGLPGNDGDYSWQWQWASTQNAPDADWTNLPDATDSTTYTPSTAATAVHIRAVVTFTDLDGYEETRPSAGTAAVAAAPPPVITVEATPDSVTGTGGARAVFTLTRTARDITAELEVGIRFTGIGVATGSPPTMATFEADMATEEVSVPVNSLGVGDESESVTLTVQDGTGYTLGDPAEATVTVMAPMNSVATGMPSVGGTPQVGQVLTAGIGNIMDIGNQPTEADLDWQWQRQMMGNWDDIPGAMSKRYTLHEDDEGLRVRVEASFNDSANQLTERVYSDPIGPVTPAPENRPPEGGPPTITGTARVTQELTAMTTGISDPDGPATLTFMYQWRRADDAAGATGAMDIGSKTTSNTYTLTTADAGKYIQVVVSYTDGINTEESLESAWTEVLNSDPAGGPPTITGTARVTGTLTAMPGTITDADGGVPTAVADFMYQWRRADDGSGASDTNIGSPTTSNTYTLTTDDAGKYIQVVVLYTDGGGTEERLPSAWTEVENSAPAGGPPTITGTARVTQELTAMTTGISDADGPGTLTFMYQWRRADDNAGTMNAMDIGSATSSNTYMLTTADAGKYIQVVVSYTDGGDTEESLSSAWTEVENSAPAGGPPTITGTARVTGTLTAVATGISDADGPGTLSFMYQWRRADDNAGTMNAMDIGSPTTSNTYMLTTDDAGKYIQVVVSYTDGGDTEESLPSAWTEVENSAPTGGPPTITGTARVTQELTAVATGISDPDGPGTLTFMYQWRRADDAAGTTGAMDIGSPTTANTYMLTTDDAGKYIQVVVSYTDGGDTEESLPSAWTEVLNSDPTGGPPTITGTAQVTRELTAMTTGISDPDGPGTLSFMYQWRRADDNAGTMNAMDIGSATSSNTYTLVEDDAGKYIQVVVSYTDGGDTEESLPSAWTQVLNTRSTGKPAITGVARVDERLTAGPGNVADADGIPAGAIMYTWLRFDAAGTTQEAEAGTGPTYTLVEADVGRKIRLVAGFLDGGGGPERRTGDPWPDSGTVEKRADMAATGDVTIDGGSTAQVNVELTANTSDIEDTVNGLTAPNFSYQWERADDVTDPQNPTGLGNAGTDSENYTPTEADDLGKFLRVTVTFMDDDEYEETKTSDWTAMVGAAPTTPDTEATGDVTITGGAAPQVDVELTADTSDIDDPANGLTTPNWRYQWRRADDASDTGGEDIRNATSATYTPAREDEDKFLRVTVMFTDDDSYPESKEAWTGAAVAKRADTEAEGEVTITGGAAAQVDVQLTADTSAITDPVNGPTSPIPQARFTYQWERADDVTDPANPTGLENAGTDSENYTPTEADDQDKFLRVTVTFTDDDDYEESKTSAWTRAVAARADTEATGDVTITGGAAPQVDVQLTADTSDIDDPANGLTTPNWRYQWRRADDAIDTGGEDIATATTASYTPVKADEGSFLRVTVTFMDDDGHEESKEAWTDVAVAARANTAASGDVMITGGSAARVGVQLTADTSAITDPVNRPTSPIPQARFTYQWERADDVTDPQNPTGLGNAGADSETYTPTRDDDQGKFLRVTVTFTDDDGHEETKTSGWTAAVQKRADTEATGDVLITGGSAPQVSVQLTADTSGIGDPVNGLTSPTFSYQWERADDNTGSTGLTDVGSDAASYTPAVGDEGKFLRVTVTFMDDDDYEETKESDWTAAVGAAPTTPDTPATGDALITGGAAPQVGVPLTADTSGIDDPANGLTPPTTFRYQWRRADDASDTGGVDIRSATSASYTPVKEDEDKFLRVTVMFTDDDNYPESKEAWTGAAVAKRADTEATGDVTITGGAAPRVSVALTADTSGIDDPVNGLTAPGYTYQWERADDNTGSTGLTDVGSNAASYTPAAGDEGGFLRVTVTFMDDDDYEETKQSDWTAAVMAAPTTPDTEATGNVVITGGAAAQVDVALTADTSGIDDPVNGLTSPTFSYQWERADDNTGSTGLTDVGSNAASYTPVAGDEGRFLRVTVTFTDDDDYPETKTSDWTAAVMAAHTTPDTEATGDVTITGGTAAQVGVALTADVSAIDDPVNGLTAPGYTYQWRRADDASDTNGADIGSATSATYTPVAGDEGMFLRVTVTFTDDDGHEETKQSAWTAAVMAAPTPTPVPPDTEATGNVIITGAASAQVGVVLTADTSGIADPVNGLSAPTFSYRWQRADNESGITGLINVGSDAASYTPVETDEGRFLRVTVTFTDDDDYPESKTSAWTAAVAAAPTAAEVAVQTERVRETTDQSLALLAPSVATNTVQVLTARFERIATGAPGSPTLGGVRLGALAGAGGVSTAKLTREAAALFGLHLPAAGAAATAATGATSAGAAGSGVSTSPATGTPGAFKAQGRALPGMFDAHGTEAQFGRGASDSGDWRAFDTGNLRSPDLRRLLAQSSFSVGLGAAHGAHGGGAHGGSHWTLWGRGATSGFEGTHEDSALDIEGENNAAYLGADLQRGSLALGVAVGWSFGKMDYAGAASDTAGELETDLTSFHPYLHWSGGENTSIYAMLGFGSGEATLNDAGLTASLESDLDMRMLAAGIRNTLSHSASGRRYDLKLDAFWVDLESDGADATERDRVRWQATNTQSRRVRLSLEGTFPLSQGIWASGELAARADSGGAQSGSGMELGAGLRWAQGGFSLSAEGYVLLVHNGSDMDDYEERGASLSASYRAGGAAAGRGLRFTLSPTWGDVQSGVDALYESTGALRELGDAGRQSRSSRDRSDGGLLPDRLDFELGYGLAALGGRAELLPFGRLSLSGGASETRLRLGTRFDLPHRLGDALAARRLGFELFGEERMGEADERRVGLELKLGF